jgi:hypothetical protein
LPFLTLPVLGVQAAGLDFPPEIPPPSPERSIRVYQPDGTYSVSAKDYQRKFGSSKLTLKVKTAPVYSTAAEGLDTFQEKVQVSYGNHSQDDIFKALLGQVVPESQWQGLYRVDLGFSVAPFALNKRANEKVQATISELAEEKRQVLLQSVPMRAAQTVAKMNLPSTHQAGARAMVEEEMRHFINAAVDQKVQAGFEESERRLGKLTTLMAVQEVALVVGVLGNDQAVTIKLGISKSNLMTGSGGRTRQEMLVGMNIRTQRMTSYYPSLTASARYDRLLDLKLGGREIQAVASVEVALFHDQVGFVSSGEFAKQYLLMDEKEFDDRMKWWKLDSQMVSFKVEIPYDSGLGEMTAEIHGTFGSFQGDKAGSVGGSVGGRRWETSVDFATGRDSMAKTGFVATGTVHVRGDRRMTDSEKLSKMFSVITVTAGYEHLSNSFQPNRSSGRITTDDLFLGLNALVLAKKNLIAKGDYLEIWANVGYKFNLGASAEGEGSRLDENLNGAWAGFNASYRF